MAQSLTEPSAAQGLLSVTIHQTVFIHRAGSLVIRGVYEISRQLYHNLDKASSCIFSLLINQSLVQLYCYSYASKYCENYREISLSPLYISTLHRTTATTRSRWRGWCLTGPAPSARWTTPPRPRSAAPAGRTGRAPRAGCARCGRHAVHPVPETFQTLMTVKWKVTQQRSCMKHQLRKL